MIKKELERPRERYHETVSTFLTQSSKKKNREKRRENLPLEENKL